MGNEHAAVMIWFVVGVFAVANHGDTLRESIKGHLGIGSQVKVIVGLAFFGLACFLLLPTMATAVSLLMEWIPETPAVVSCLRFTQG